MYVRPHDEESSRSEFKISERQPEELFKTPCTSSKDFMCQLLSLSRVPFMLALAYRGTL